MSSNNEQMKVYMANRRLSRRQTLLDMSDNKCARCADTSNLEFNHIDRSSKLFGLSGHGLDRSWDKILTEWRKCELLCRLCHVQYTQMQYHIGDMPLPWNKLSHVEYVHGTMRCYHETSCRCDLCKLAKKAYRNKEIDYHSRVA